MSSTMDFDALRAEMERLRAENAKLKSSKKPAASPPKAISWKVSEKTGALSIYGLNARFPTTLYKDQWVKIFEKKDEIMAFMEANADKLKTKAVEANDS